MRVCPLKCLAIVLTVFFTATAACSSPVSATDFSLTGDTVSVRVDTIGVPQQDENAETRDEQEEEAAEEPSPWDMNLRGGLNGSQAAFRNWSQGGVNNITAIAVTAFTGKYQRGKFANNFNLNLRYGQTRLEDNEFVKSDDLIRFRNQVSRRFDDEQFGLVFNIHIQTQFDKGMDSNRENVISRFLAPAFITETIGFSFKPTGTHLEIDAGLAMKQTIVRDRRLSTRYGLDEGQRFGNEAGFSLVFKYERELMKNVTYSGYLETFSNVLKRLDSTDFLFTNELEGRINQYLSANFEFALQYNDNISRELQVKQLMSLGLNFSLL